MRSKKTEGINKGRSIKVLTVLSSLTLAACMSAFAQTSDTSDSQMKNDTQMSGKPKTHRMKSDKMMGKKTSMTGCVSEDNGKFMLMNKQHPGGLELMSSEDLKPHVGHKIKVTGMMSNGSMATGNGNSGDTSNMNSNDSGMQHDKGMEMMTMKVDSMKMISENCSMKNHNTMGK